MTRPNLHAMKSVMRPKKGKRRIEDEEMEESTAATSVVEDSGKKKKTAKEGLSIAPLPYSNFNDRQLELLLRKQFRDMAYRFTDEVNTETFADVKFNVIDKEVHGVKMTAKKTESRLKIENDWYEKAKPSAAKYTV